MSYPLPHYAASIWISGDKINLALPGIRTEKGHTITVPNTEAGMSVIHSVLKERSREGYEAKVGTKAAPIQYDIDAVLRSMTKVPPTAKELKREAPTTLSLADLDL